MRIRWIAASLMAAALAGPAPAAQAPSDTNTVSQPQQGDDSQSDLIWNLIGCVGLLGLLGLFRSSDNDGYTDDPI